MYQNNARQTKLKVNIENAMRRIMAETLTHVPQNNIKGIYVCIQTTEHCHHTLCSVTYKIHVFCLVMVLNEQFCTTQCSVI